MSNGDVDQSEQLPNLDNQIPICGIIMPISATSAHSEQHWSGIRTLLHRVIREAGFEPRNVWENSATDRISERIISNIFTYPIIVADISDLNPNVMLELGMRLSSKKPTQVIVNGGGTIPFDIRDFHALPYPENTSMIAMEAFFEEFKAVLKVKYDASQKSNYIPFLGNIVIDVLSPQERPVSADQIVLNKLDEINRRIVAVEENQLSIKNSTAMAASKFGDLDLLSLSKKPTGNGPFWYNVPTDNSSEIFSRMKALGDSKIEHVISVGDRTYFAVYIPHSVDTEAQSSINSTTFDMISKLGGSTGIPRSHLQTAFNVGVSL